MDLHVNETKCSFPAKTFIKFSVSSLFDKQSSNSSKRKGFRIISHASPLTVAAVKFVDTVASLSNILRPVKNNSFDTTNDNTNTNILKIY